MRLLSAAIVNQSGQPPPDCYFLSSLPDSPNEVSAAGAILNHGNITWPDRFPAEPRSASVALADFSVIDSNGDNFTVGPPGSD